LAAVGAVVRTSESAARSSWPRNDIGQLFEPVNKKGEFVSSLCAGEASEQPIHLFLAGCVSDGRHFEQLRGVDNVDSPMTLPVESVTQFTLDIPAICGLDVRIDIDINADQFTNDDLRLDCSVTLFFYCFLQRLRLATSG
jgi:hypothetical protein